MSYEIAPRHTASSWRRDRLRVIPGGLAGQVCAGPDSVPYRVHEAGELEPDGSQRCIRCGLVLLEYAPDDASLGARARRRGESWGFPVGRRVIVGPTCTFLVTADRELAPDEESCS